MRNLAPGTMIGDSVILSDGPPREYDSGRVEQQCLLECACGRTLLRLKTYLRKALEEGIGVCCSECLGELKRGFLSDRQSRRSRAASIAYAGAWKTYGSLYSPSWEEGFSRRFLRDLVDEFGPLDEGSDSVTMHSGLTVASWPWPSGPATEQDPPQQDQWLFSVSSEAGWACSTCGRAFPSGFGCVRCLAPTCGSCKAAGRHVCRRGWWKTWGEEENSAARTELLDVRLRKLNRRQLVELRTRKAVA